MAKVGARIDDSHLAGAFLDGPFIREESQRMVEDLHGPDLMRQALRGLSLQAKRGQNVALFEHKVPMDPLGCCVFLDDESAHHQSTIANHKFGPRSCKDR